MNNYTTEIYKYLKIDKIKIEYYDTLPSTNLLLKEKARTENEGLVVIANNQTAGRGRFNRRFYSPEDCGIYMSILLKPHLGAFNATLITTAAAVAVAEAAERLSGKKTEIKWVNDVLIDGKKICGILTEGSINSNTLCPHYVVLGIGINAFLPKNGFDGEIKDIAGYVFDTESEELKARLTAEVINKFFEYYKALENKAFLKSYREKSCVIGKEIFVIKGDNPIKAIALGINDDLSLRVKYADLSTENLNSGEISIKLR